MILKGSFFIRNKKEFLNLKNFIKVYFAFLILGLIADLIFGLWITKLWDYPGYNLFNYLILYFFIYPFGGFVMVYSFSLLESVFIRKPRENNVAYKHSLMTALIVAAVGFLGFFISVFFVEIFKGFFIYSFFTLFGWGITNYIILKIKKNNLLEHIFVKSLKYLILILVAAYVQGIFHELPNLFAKEWVYQNWPFNEVTLLGIPVTVLLFGWLALVFVPYAVFEFIMLLNKVKNIKNLKHLIKEAT